MPSLDGSVSPSLDGFANFSLPSLDGFALPSFNGLSLPSLGGSLLPSLDGLLSPSLDGFFLVFTIFFEGGGEAVPAGVVRSTLTPDLQDFSGFGSGQFIISCSLDLHLKHTRPA